MAPTPSRRSTPAHPSAPARRAGTSRPRPSTTAKPRRVPTGGLRRRKPEPESNAKKVLGAVSAALPGLLEKASGPAKKAKPSGGKKSAGLALAGAGAAGFAALKKRSSSKSEPTPVPVTPVHTNVTPATPVAQDGAITPTDAPGAI